VRRCFDLASPFEALAELTKGKVTTVPEHHTAEGVFFTSKAVERFELEANGVEWIVDNARADYTARQTNRAEGTRVRFVAPRAPRKALSDVFAEHTDDLEFMRTRTHVKLFAIGTEFMSRSEARRLLHGLDRFREVVLDFEAVELAGQGFADEVFRVWPAAHPETRITTQNLAPAVDFVIRRARGT
jgi:hypothetical protein